MVLEPECGNGDYSDPLGGIPEIWAGAHVTLGFGSPRFVTITPEPVAAASLGQARPVLGSPESLEPWGARGATVSIICMIEPY